MCDDLPTGINFTNIHNKAVNKVYEKVYKTFREGHWEFDNPLHTEHSCRTVVNFIINEYNKSRNELQPTLPY